MSWDVERGCLYKNTHLSKDAAKQACASVNRKNRRLGKPEAHIYRCPGCGLWHIGRPSGTNGGSLA